MVDVSEKPATMRKAAAGGTVHVSAETFGLIMRDEIKKGDVLGVAQLAGIMAAKKTPELIPMCHPVNITGVDISISPDKENCLFGITASVLCKGETGVEMEALTAVAAAALTIYDMCKSVQKDIKISNIRLLYKSGGKSGEYMADDV